jgi:hypothetical protein
MQEQDAEMLEVLLQGGANPSQPNKDVTRCASAHACPLGITLAIRAAYALPFTRYMHGCLLNSALLRQLDWASLSTGSAVRHMVTCCVANVFEHHPHSCACPGVCGVCSALHAAAQRGPLKLMQLLLDHKAEVYLADAKGWTPLHLAARAGAAAKVECLLAAGAKVSDTNSQGNTPLHLVSSCCVWAGGVEVWLRTRWGRGGVAAYPLGAWRCGCVPGVCKVAARA